MQERPKTNNGVTIDLLIVLAAMGLTLSTNFEQIASGTYSDTPLS